MIFEVNVVFLQVSKAAIGLARLCLDPTTADSVVRLGGLDKLFPLAEVSNWILAITLKQVKRVGI